MGATLTTANNIMKELYPGQDIEDQLQSEVVGFTRLEHTSRGVESHVGGKYVTFPLRTKRNSGISYRNESEALAPAGQQGYASVRVGLKYGYGRINLTGQAMDLVDENYQAFAAAVEQEMSGVKADINKDCSRIFYGDSTGNLGNVTVKPGANQLTVGNAQYLEVGQVIDVYDTTGVTLRITQRNITNLVVTTEPAATITYDGADGNAGISIGDEIVRYGNIGKTDLSAQREPQGLKSLVSDAGIVQTLDPASNAFWKAINNNNAGTPRALSENLMIKVTDDVRKQGGKTSLILMSLGVRRAYFALLQQQRRYTDVKTFDGGIQGLAFHNGREIPCVDDIDCQYNTAYFLDESSFTVYRDKPWAWQDKDGGVWKWVTGFDAWEAMLKQYWEIGINKRNANAVLKDITEG